VETVGVLGLQGDYLEHEEILKIINPDLNVVRVLHAGQVEQIDRLILPGGESTTMNKLANHMIRQTKLFDALKSRLINNHLPVLATCAGIILLAQEIKSFPERESLKPYLNTLPIRVLRNHYGRQQFSFETPLDINGFDTQYPAVFIRAPVVEMLENNGVEVLASYKGNPALIKYKNVLATTFHPELVADQRIHKLFLELND
jgi:5'-phosphate synthase pdxT subunit